MELLNFTGARKLPLILQSEKTECALACIAMVMAYYGHRIDINSLRSRLGVSQQGTNLKTVMTIADRVNLNSRPLRLELGDLDQLRTPAILHWNMNHFVVLKAVKGKLAIIHDPAVGEASYDLKSLSRHFTGIGVELQPADEFEVKKEERKLRFRDLWSKSEGLVKNLSQLLLLSFLLQLFALALPFYTQLFIDDVLVSQDFDLLKILALGFFLITIIKSCTELIRSYVILHVSNLISFQFATNICRHLFRLPVEYFSKRHMGDIVSRFGSLNNIKDFLCSGIVEIVIDGVMVLATLSLMFVYSSLLTFIALLAVLAYALLRSSTYSAFHARNEELINNSALENTNFMENIKAIQGIKLFGKETDRLTGWKNYYADVINSGVKLQKLNINVKFAHGILVGSENIILMVLGGYAVLNNQISIGMLIAYISFKDQFYNRVFALMDKVFEFKLLDVHLSRLGDITLSKPEQFLQGTGMLPGGESLPVCLDVQDIAFKYSKDSPMLFSNINLQIKREEAISIIGPTGCGKSTFLKILMSLLQPDRGVLSMQGIPVRSMGLGSYRENIAGVMQDDTLLSGTILDNITFFDRAPDRKRVEYVANLAAIAKDIHLMPMQYNTLVGSMGAALSGGQIQRILLARALYKKPKLLILDEATSHLDIETETAVNIAIKEMKIARLIVAHRPQTILSADRILKLNMTGLIPVQHSEIIMIGEECQTDIIMI
jgi:ATP-binding cassette, subfamily B, bacterial CvaB/MchF/RaxB